MSDGPALSVLGVSKAHAEKAIRHMRNRSLLAFYRAEDKSLNTWPIQGSDERAYKAMSDALEATR